MVCFSGNFLPLFDTFGEYIYDNLRLAFLQFLKVARACWRYWILGIDAEGHCRLSEPISEFNPLHMAAPEGVCRGGRSRSQAGSVTEFGRFRVHCLRIQLVGQTIASDAQGLKAQKPAEAAAINPSRKAPKPLSAGTPSAVDIAQLIVKHSSRIVSSNIASILIWYSSIVVS